MKRRSMLAGAIALGACVAGGVRRRALTVYTFGDSILDSGAYNEFGLTPGRLIVQNEDRLFPEFTGRDLSSRMEAHLEHHAQDGATVDSLAMQANGLQDIAADAVALLTVGGNDLLLGLVVDSGSGIREFGRALDEWLRALPIRPVLVGNVYDPSFGDDSRNFLGVDPTLARANHRRMNDVLAEAGARYGRAVDLHAHFLTGDQTWFTQTIEPSLIGTSEVRRAFLARMDIL